MKTTQRGGPHGSDAGKKVNGPKRRILVDTTGLVQSASGPCRSSDIDREGVQLLLEPLKGVFARLKKVWVDQADTGTGVDRARNGRGSGGGATPPRPRGIWVGPGLEITPERLAVFERPRGFRHLPRRWVVERTFAWVSRSRRLRRDDEYSTNSRESRVCLILMRLMVKRLARAAEAAREKARQAQAA